MTAHRGSEMSDRAVAGRAVYARNFGVDAAAAERIMSEHAGMVSTRKAFEVPGAGHRGAADAGPAGKAV